MCTTIYIYIYISNAIEIIHTDTKSHAPVYLQFKVEYVVKPRDVDAWDRDKLMRAVQGDFRIRDPFCKQFNQAFLEKEDKTKDSIGDSSDEIWNRVSTVVLNVARQHFRRQEDRTMQTLQTWKKIFVRPCEAEKANWCKQAGSPRRFVVFPTRCKTRFRQLVQKRPSFARTDRALQ